MQPDREFAEAAVRSSHVPSSFTVSWLGLVLCTGLLSLGAACGGGGGGKDGKADDTGDTDADTDTDTDADTDADGDADTDADTDTDVDCTTNTLSWDGDTLNTWAWAYTSFGAKILAYSDTTYDACTISTMSTSYSGWQLTVGFDFEPTAGDSGSVGGSSSQVQASMANFTDSSLDQSAVSGTYAVTDATDGSIIYGSDLTITWSDGTTTTLSDWEACWCDRMDDRPTDSADTGL